MGPQQAGPRRGAGQQDHVGLARLEELEQVVHGGVGPQLRDGPHAQCRHRDVGKHVNEHQLLHQHQPYHSRPENAL